MRTFVLALFFCAGAALAQDDFTDIPDFPDTPTPSPSATVPPPDPVITAPPAVVTPAKPPVGPVALIEKYEKGRLKAITDRVLTVTVCGRNMWGGDSRRSHAIVHRGDELLAEADGLWEHALKTGDRAGMEKALRYLDAVHADYKAARYPPRDYRFTYRDSPPPKPIREARPSEEHPGTPGMGTRVEPAEEPVIWNRHDQVPE